MSSGFITETEATEIRKRRQEEWEKVRKADDPVERPEEPYDPRSLYERLQEQKQKKDLEYEEAHKLKNMIKGLDDDEIEFLDMVDRTKLEADRKKEMEEERELNDYRNRVAILQEKSIEERLQAEIMVNKPKTPINNRSSQQKLLKGIVIKKNEGTLKRKLSDSECNLQANEAEAKSHTKSSEPEAKVAKTDTEETGDDNKNLNGNIETKPDSGLKCVGILPGLGFYEDSSSDENSSDSEIEVTPIRKMDMLGRKIGKTEGNS